MSFFYKQYLHDQKGSRQKDSARWSDHKVFVVQVVQAAEEVCCLRKADGNPFGFALMRQLL